MIHFLKTKSTFYYPLTPFYFPFNCFFLREKPKNKLFLPFNSRKNRLSKTCHV